MRQWRTRASVVLAGFAALLVLPMTTASAGTASGIPPTPEVAGLFPTELQLGVGFQPEGIAIGVLPFAYFGSLANGDILRVDLITGRSRVISEGPGTPSVGLKIDARGRLFVSGGPAGNARVVSAFSGKVLASYQFATAPTFINDVVVTPRAAYFTDSMKAFLYKLPLGRHGELPTQAQVQSIPLGGEWVQQAGFNANGIARTPDGSALLVVQSATGFLFRVDPATGVATRVNLGANLLTAGDGLLLVGHTLYAVQNQLNQVAVVTLNDAGTAGTVGEPLTDPRFKVPTTVAVFGPRLYLPNAQFGVASPATTPYNAIAIRRG
jgi:hypothetical protein